MQRIEWHGSWKPIAEFAIDAAESDCVDAMANGNRQCSVRRIAFAFSYCNVHVAGVLLVWHYCSVAARLALLTGTVVLFTVYMRVCMGKS